MDNAEFAALADLVDDQRHSSPVQADQSKLIEIAAEYDRVVSSLNDIGESENERSMMR